MVARQHPTVVLSPDASSVVDDPGVDAIVIATPVATHYDLVAAALDAGKHVLVTKPLAASVEEADELVALAERKSLVLLVDHTFIYTGAVEKLRSLIREGALGDVYYVDSVRINLGRFQHDVNVLWDLAAHDLSILAELFEQEPVGVQVIGARRANGTHEDIGYLTVFYPDGMMAHLHVSWLSPVKIRHTIIAGSDRMVVWNDLAPDEQIKIYDRGVSLPASDPEQIYSALVDYRSGEVWIPQLDRREALAKEVDHFVDCVCGDADPRTGGDVGARVVRLLEASDRSVALGGARVDVQ